MDRILAYVVLSRHRDAVTCIAARGSSATVKHGDVVRGGKADAAFGVRLPSKPDQALRIRRMGQAGAPTSRA